MDIGLIDVDGHNFPNFALMKIYAWHKRMGDNVEWVNYLKSYDKVYMAKVFTFTPDSYTSIQAEEIIKGGTGYSISSKLPEEIENCPPDFTLYSREKWYDANKAYGFITRGCIRHCPWCVVPEKEGMIRKYSDIEDVLQGRKCAVLMDNNFLASECCYEQLGKMAKTGCRIDFNQGLDARIILADSHIAKLLARVKWIRYIRLACDSDFMLPIIKNAVELLEEAGIKRGRIFVYSLITDLQGSYRRIKALKDLGVTVFGQPFRDFTPEQKIPGWQKDMARWCNDRAVFRSCDFKDYKPRNNFFCGDYFTDNFTE